MCVVLHNAPVRTCLRAVALYVVAIPAIVAVEPRHATGARNRRATTRERAPAVYALRHRHTKRDPRVVCFKDLHHPGIVGYMRVLEVQRHRATLELVRRAPVALGVLELHEDDFFLPSVGIDHVAAELAQTAAR